jgi:hypothetical protein
MKFYKKTDLLVIGSMLVVCLGIWGIYQVVFTGKQVKAEIYYGSELVQTVDLSTGEERRFTVPQNEHVVFHLYNDGSICFESSNCPDQICVHSGRISKVGESAACLPNQLILKIVPRNGYDTSDADIIV